MSTTTCPNPFCKQDMEIPFQGFEGIWMCNHCSELARVDTDFVNAKNNQSDQNPITHHYWS